MYLAVVWDESSLIVQKSSHGKISGAIFIQLEPEAFVLPVSDPSAGSAGDGWKWYRRLWMRCQRCEKQAA
jgi:hypothetical protein